MAGKLKEDLPQLEEVLDVEGQPSPLLWKTAVYISKDPEHDGTDGVIEDEDTNVPQNGVEGCQKNGARHLLPLPTTAQKVASESQAAVGQRQ